MHPQSSSQGRWSFLVPPCLLLLPPLSRPHHPRPELLQQLCCSPLVPPIHPALSCQIHLFKSTALIMSLSCHHMEAKGQGLGRLKAWGVLFRLPFQLCFLKFSCTRTSGQGFCCLTTPIRTSLVCAFSSDIGGVLFFFRGVGINFNLFCYYSIKSCVM